MPEPVTSPERYSLAVITDDETIYPEIRKQLGAELRTTVASDEMQIKDVLEQPDLHAVLFDLDCIGDGPVDGLDVLAEIRKIRDDIKDRVAALVDARGWLRDSPTRRSE